VEHRGAGQRRWPWVAAFVAVIAGVVAWAVVAKSRGGVEQAVSVAGVTIAAGVLEQGEPWVEDGAVTGRTTSPAFLISPGSDQAAVDSVLAAATRFYAINEFGHEISHDDPDYSGYYTPSWVAAFRTSAGVVLLADTSGDLPLAQGETMVAVLTEELTARNVTAHIDAMPEDLALGEQITS
jgi:hypothetical protein